MKESWMAEACVKPRAWSVERGEMALFRILDAGRLSLGSFSHSCRIAQNSAKILIALQNLICIFGVYSND